MRPAPLAVVLLLALAGCGGEERVASAPAGTDVSVRVIGVPGSPGPFSLRCGAGGGCDPRRVDRLAAALASVGDRARVCTELYGGPERAHVTGRLKGRAVDVEVTRSDGCGIADYEALFAALGRSAPLAP